MLWKALTFITSILACQSQCAISDASRALQASWTFYKAQRSGKQTATRVPWRGDAFVSDTTASGKCLVGGHFDAGDNVYFGLPYSWTASTIAFGLTEFPGGFSNYLLPAWEHLRWMADYMVDCYVSDDEIVVGMGDPDADHAQWMRPEDYSTSRQPYAISKTKPGSDVAAGMSAAIAATAYVFTHVDPAYSKSLLPTAMKLYQHALAYQGMYSDSVPVAATFYKSSGYKDELAWAATWLGIATGNTSMLDQALMHLRSAPVPWPLPSWNDAYHYALVVLSRRYPQLQPNVTSMVDAWLKGSNGIVYTPKGLAWGFQWGSLRYTANGVLFALSSVSRLPATDPRRIEVTCWAKKQIDYILDNGFVVGLGQTPCKPHHRSSSCPGTMRPCNWDAFNAPGCNPNVLLGALVGGPGSDDGYADSRQDYMKNEVAIDYNAGWTAALAGLIQSKDAASKCK